MGLGVGVMSSLGTSLGVTRHSIYAKDFDGSDQSITPNVSTIEAIAGCVRTDLTEFSFAVWVKMHTVSSSCTLFKLGNTSGTTNQMICIYHAYYNEFRFVPKFGNTAVTLNGGETNADGDSYENDGLWHLLVGTISQTTDKQAFWIDGDDKETIDGVETLDQAINYFAIGQNGSDGGYFNGEIDEFCMWEKALTDDDIADLYNDRATSGDRIVDITQHETLSEGLILYHKFEEQSGTLAINYAESTEGAELVTNGDFATDSDWNKGTGITISGGSANFTGNSNANINQNAGLVNGILYRATFTISNYVSGDIDINVGGNTRQGSYAANGDYTIYVTSDSGAILYFQENSSAGGFVGSIDNVSVKAITGHGIYDNAPATIISTI
tara:strand:+ start:535 stop:1683 length:1149 start_codon:yes stop_codon:yes gene_type:complete